MTVAGGEKLLHSDEQGGEKKEREQFVTCAKYRAAADQGDNDAVQYVLAQSSSKQKAK